MADGQARELPTSYECFDLEVEVAQTTMLTEDIMELELQDATGRRELPPWSPGAHIDLVLNSGLIRQYSICGDPSNRTSYRICVLRQRDSQGGSVEVHDSCVPGTPNS